MPADNSAKETVGDTNSVSALNTLPDDAREDYVQALNELKSNSVPKSDYERLRLENQKLIKSIVDGGPSPIQAEPVEPQESIQDLRKDLFDGKRPLSNLEYVTKALELRQRLINSGETDPFLPNGHKLTPTYEDEQAAQRVAEGLQHCVDVADGNEDVFMNEFNRIVRDVHLPSRSGPMRR